jgi:hypothetical protein
MSSISSSQSLAWCGKPSDLVTLLRTEFGKGSILIRSPHHLQVKREAQIHNVWIDSRGNVKFLLAGQAGRAQIAESALELLKAIATHDSETSTLAEMQRALELPELIRSAKAAFPFAGLSRAVFVDAGIKGKTAQIGIVKVSIEADGEHVRAESHPTAYGDSNEVERVAIEFALKWADADDVIFCDNQAAVVRAQATCGDRVRWLPRHHNRVADGVANLRSTSKKKKRRRRSRKKKKPDPK